MSNLFNDMHHTHWERQIMLYGVRLRQVDWGWFTTFTTWIFTNETRLTCELEWSNIKRKYLCNSMNWRAERETNEMYYCLKGMKHEIKLHVISWKGNVKKSFILHMTYDLRQAHRQGIGYRILCMLVWNFYILQCRIFTCI